MFLIWNYKPQNRIPPISLHPPTLCPPFVLYFVYCFVCCAVVVVYCSFMYVLYYQPLKRTPDWLTSSLAVLMISYWLKPQKQKLIPFRTLNEMLNFWRSSLCNVINDPLVWRSKITKFAKSTIIYVKTFNTHPHHKN